MGITAFRLINNPQENTVKRENIFSVNVVGISLGLMMMGYAVLFYLIISRLPNIKIPVDFSYPPLLGTKMPFLFPLTISSLAAVIEEFVFRLFALTFFKKVFKVTWVAVLLSAVFWAVGHADSLAAPLYSRSIELTFTGILLGYVYLKYGIEASILAHYVYNAMITGWPLLTSSNLYFKLSAGIIVSLAFAPACLSILLLRKRSG